MKKQSKALIFVAGVLIFVIYCYVAVMHFLYPINYKEQIIEYSNEYNLSKELVASLINAESSFNKDAVSNRGAKGLMQIMPSTASWLAEKLNIEYSEEMLFQSDYNIHLGTYYLRYLTNKFEDTTVVLCAYNAGEGVVSEWLANTQYSDNGKTLKSIPYPSTRAYVKKIFDGLRIYTKKLK